MKPDRRLPTMNKLETPITAPTHGIKAAMMERITITTHPQSDGGSPAG